MFNTMPKKLSRLANSLLKVNSLLKKEQQTKKEEIPTLLQKLYAEKKVKIHKLTQKQQLYNRNFNLKRKKLEESYKEKELDIIERQEKRKNTSIIKSIFSKKIIILSIISFVLFFWTSQVAYLKRGYLAIGGEGIFILIPFLLILLHLRNLLHAKEEQQQDKRHTP